MEISSPQCVLLESVVKYANSIFSKPKSDSLSEHALLASERQCYVISVG